MSFIIWVDIVLFLIVLKFFLDIYKSTKKLKENRGFFAEKLKDKKKYPNL
jgi:hypothetical protein